MSTGRNLYLQSDVGRQWIAGPLTRGDERPKVSYGYALTAPSKGGNLSDHQTMQTGRTWKI